MIIFAYLSALIVVTAAQQNLPCEANRFKDCTAGLADNLGSPFQASSIWIDSMVFRENLNQLFVKGDMTNYAKICNALQTFYACLGPEIYNCLGVFGLTSQNMDPYMAYSYEGLLTMWRFQCGAGFYGTKTIGGLSCIQNTIKNFDNKFKPLLKSYMSNVEHDPANCCQYARNLSRGYQDVYTQGSCAVDPVLSRFAGWYGCEGQNEYTSAEFPECAPINECHYEESVNSTEYVKLIDGVLKVKVGPTWTKNERGKWYQEPEKWI